MRVTLIKYISKEIWSIFLTCLIVFIFIIMASEMLNMTELMVNYGVGFSELFSLILCRIPRFILFSIPAACLTAVLLSFIRMASDNEIIALHSSGISIYQLMPPVIIFSVICLIISVFLTLFWNPYGNRTYQAMSLNMMKSRADFMVKERIFGNLVKDVVFYINSYSPKDKIMNDIFVVHKNEGREITIVAKKAKFISSKNNIVIRFIDGIMITDDKDGKSGSNKFGFLDYPVELDGMMGSSLGGAKDPEEMYLSELLEYINKSSEDKRNQNLAKLTLYEMFSLPLAVMVIGIAGAPLGAQIRSKGRTKGIIISLLLFLSYYIILMTVRYLCEDGAINPAMGVWLPVLYLSLICLFLLFRSAGNSSHSIFDRLTFNS